MSDSRISLPSISATVIKEPSSWLWLVSFVYRFQSVVDWPYCCVLLLATINKHTGYTSSVMFIVRVGFGRCCLSVFFSGGSWVFHLVLDMRLFTGLHIAMCWPQICCVGAKCGSGKECGERGPERGGGGGGGGE